MRIGVILAFSAIALWATNALAAGFALAELGVVQVLALQFGGAAAVILAAMLSGIGVAGAKYMGGVGGLSGAVAVGVIGLTGTISLQYLAFATAPIVEANVISYGWPLFAAVWAAVAYRTRQTMLGVPLAVVGFAGVAIILLSGGGQTAGNGGASGYVAALASAACMTFYTVMSGRTGVSVYVLLLPATLFGAAAMLVLCITGIAGWTFSSPGAWAWALYAGVGPMAGGFFLWSRAMSGDGVKRLAPLGYATPLASTALLLAFGETFTPGAFVGAALILACSIGVLVLNGREVR